MYKRQGQDNRVVDGVRLERRHALGRKAPVFDEAFLGAFFHGDVHRSQGHACGFGDFALREPSRLRQGVDDFELVMGKCHGDSLSCSDFESVAQKPNTE